MNIRFYTDPDGDPHIYAHGVGEAEVIEALRRPLERVAGRDDSVVVIDRMRSDRDLKIIFADPTDGDGIFIVTAFDLPDKQLRALNRRLNRRRRS